jgi:hypothetical protein
VAGLHVAGSEDHHHYRNTAYRTIGQGPQHWLVAQGGHNVGATGSIDLILEVTGTFIDAYLNDKTEQRQRLNYASFQSFAPALKHFTSKAPRRFPPLDQRDFVAWARAHLPWGSWLHELGMSQAATREVTDK